MRRRVLRNAYRAVLPLLAVAFGAYVLRSADLARVRGLLGSLGWRLPLLLLPNFAVTLIEAVAWWRSFSIVGERPRFWRLVRVRLSTEAVMLGVPSGGVIAESLQPYLLKRHCGTPLETAVVASVGRKAFVVVSHGLVLGTATLLGWGLLDQLSLAAFGTRRPWWLPSLPWLLLASAAFMIAAFGPGLAAGARGRLAERLRRVLDRLMGRWVGPWLERHAPRFQRTDEQLLRFFERDRRALVLPLLLYCSGWVVRGVETLVYLRLLGVAVSLTFATVVESALVLLRSVALPLPAGVGVQDAAYVLTLDASGVRDAATVGAAFVLLKRGKDIFWILLGFALLAAGERRRETVPSPDPTPPGN